VEGHPLLVFPEPRHQARQKPVRPRREPHFPSREDQTTRLTGRLEFLEGEFGKERARLTASLAGAEPEKVLVFEIIGSVADFARGLAAAGLEELLELTEEDIQPDDDFYAVDKHGDRKEEARLEGRLFLAMTNESSLRKVKSLWESWSRSERMRPHFGPWSQVFKRLRDVRYWDQRDRLNQTGLISDWNARVGQSMLPVEIELWFRDDPAYREAARRRVLSLVADLGGEVMGTADIAEVRYQAVAASIPDRVASEFVGAVGPAAELVRCDAVMFFRPSGQSLTRATTLDEQPWSLVQAANPVDSPVAAILDGMPLEAHPALDGRLIVDDPDGFGEDYAAAARVHGTAMASLVTSGDLLSDGSSLRSRVYVRPVMRPVDNGIGQREERIPDEVLVPDLMRRCLIRLFEGEESEPAAAPSVRVINISLGDKSRPFGRFMSAWARTLDWLSSKYGVLFVVSAGNCGDQDIDLEVARDQLLACSQDVRRDAFLDAMVKSAVDRRLLSPAETVNGITVGAAHSDSGGPVGPTPNYCDPLGDPGLPSPFSRVGLGYRRAVKPDLVSAGGRGLYGERIANSEQHAVARLRQPGKPPGNAVASPGAGLGMGGGLRHSLGTSDAAALTTRDAVLLHEQVVAHITDSAPARALDPRHEAVLLKTLLVHGAQWPESADNIKRLVEQQGADWRQARNWVTRFLGFGRTDVQRVASCTDERVTLVGWGDIGADEAHMFQIPLPTSLSGFSGRVRFTVTLAWFTPVDARRQEYRRAALSIGYEALRPSGVFQAKGQGVTDDANLRGTVYHSVQEGERTSVIGQDDALDLVVNCRAEGSGLAERVPYGIAVTLEVGEGLGLMLYDEVRSRVGLPVQVTA
jgi:hypothetical protein